VYNKDIFNRIILLVGLVLLFSCSKKDLPAIIENEDIEAELTRVPEGFESILYPEDNPFTLSKWELGKKLFYDPVLSVDFSISCATCHKPELAFSDDQATTNGVENRPGTRNSPSLTNVAYHPYYTREGGVPTLEMQILIPIQEHNEFGFNIVEACERLKEITEYVEMTEDAFGTEMTPFALTRALATFERTLISGNSPYDLHNRGDASLSSSALKGMTLFNSSKTNCSSCHSGFNFTDYSFRNNGYDSGDIGRMRLTLDSADYAHFKVPSLRNIELTVPYMHDGSFSSLREVINHYNAGGSSDLKDPLLQPLGLSDSEIGDIINFLKSLTDQEFISNKNFQE
jgi:cytochrome c peroxidase